MEIEHLNSLLFYVLQSISEQQLANSRRSHQNHTVHCERSPAQHHLPVHGPGRQHPGPERPKPHVWTCPNTRYLTRHSWNSWYQPRLLDACVLISSSTSLAMCGSFFFLSPSVSSVSTERLRSLRSPSKGDTYQPLWAIVRWIAVLKHCRDFQRSHSPSQSSSLRIHLSNYVK